MADTPTTRNRLRKQEVGAKTNAWGTDWNEDGGSDRLDESLDGVVAFTLSAPKTLTSVNYETDEARKRVINVTGGAGDTITIPALEKWYLVRAGSSGDVTVSNGSNSVTVKAGNIVPVFTDGTNVYQSRCIDYGSDIPKTTGTATLGSHLVNKTLLDATAFSAALPGQSGNSGKFVTTDGSTASWGLPTISSVTGLQTALDGKQAAGSYAAAVHGHAIADVSGLQAALDAKLALAGGTMTGLLTTVASGTGSAGFNVPHGAAPTSPTNGDIWTTTGGVFAHIAGSTQQLALAGGYSQIGTATPTGTATVQFTSIPNTYNELLLVFTGLSTAAAATVTISASGDNDSTRTTIALATTAGGSDTLYGGVDIPGYLKAAGIAVAQILSLTSDTTSGAGTSNPYAWRIAAGINAIRIGSTSNFDAGSVTLFGK